MRKLKGAISAFFAAVTAFALCSLFVAAKSGEDVIRVGFYEYPCFQEIDDDGSFSGYSDDYLQIIAQYNGWKYEYVTAYTSSECLELLKNGQIDIMGVVQKTPEREKIYDYPEYFSSISCSLLVTRADNTQYAFDDFDAFNGMTVGLQKSFARNEGFLEFAKEKSFDVNTIVYDTKEALMQALNSGEADAILISSNQNDPKYRVIAKFDPDETYYITTKGNKKILEELNYALGKINENSPYIQKELYAKYYDFSEGQAPAFSNQEAEYIASHPTLNVIYDDSWGPYEVADDEGNPCGISIDLAKKISEACKIEFNYIPIGSRDEISQIMADGKADIIAAFGYSYRNANSNNLYITQPYLSGEIVAAYKTESPNKRRVALAKNYCASELVVQEYFSDAQITYYDTVPECVEAVYKNQADYTLLSVYEMEYYLGVPKYHTINYHSMQCSPLELSVGVSKQQDPILYSIIEKSLHSISKSEIREAVRSHISDGYGDSLLNLLYGNPIEFLGIMGVICVAFIIAGIMFVLNRNNNQKRIQMQAAAQAKSEFFSRISHDMRTPLNGIMGTVYLSKDKNDVSGLKEDMKQIELSGKILLDLINDTLDMSRIENGKMELHSVSCDEDGIVLSIMSSVKPLMLKKGINFEYTKNNIGDCWIRADAKRIQQILINLITNAVKFTPSGGTVNLSVERLSQTNEIIRDKFVIRDNGIGMSREFQKKLFVAFAQENKINPDSTVGTGLGLSIVKNIVDLMGGTIEVKSEENVGTEISVILDFKIDDAKRTKSETHNYSKLCGKRVLLCEDNELNAQIAIKLLEKAGIETQRAQNGRIGLEMFRNSEEGYYDLILMDVRMPVINGLEASEAIRNLKRADAKTIPIIAMSANVMEEDINYSKQAGMNEHLPKPIDLHKLYDTMCKFLD